MQEVGKYEKTKILKLVNNFSTHVGLCASTARKTKNAKNRGQIILLFYLSHM